MSENPDEAQVTSEPAEAEAEPAPPASRTKTVARSTLRRAPRFGRFILVGVLAAALLAWLAAAVSQPLPFLGRGGIFLIVFIGLGAAGALIGGLLAVLADRRSLPPLAGDVAPARSGVEPGRAE